MKQIKFWESPFKDYPNRIVPRFHGFALVDDLCHKFWQTTVPIQTGINKAWTKELYSNKEA